MLVTPPGTPDSAAEVVDNLGILGSLAAVILLLVGAILYLVASARKQIDQAVYHAQAANEAVNNVGPGDHRLLDKIEMIRTDVESVVKAQEEFAKNGWLTLPSDLASSSALTSTIRELQHADKTIQHGLTELSDAISRIDKKISEHVDWEENVKWRRLSQEH